MHGSWRRWLLVLIFLLMASPTFGDRIAKAIRALQKGKYQQVEHLVSKSLEKNQINAGAHYVLALLYFDTTYQRYHLDSSHYFIELALSQEQLSDSIDSWPLSKTPLTRTTLLLQKHRVDSVAFQRAMAQNTVPKLQHFLDVYTTAPQYNSALQHRNELAFGLAADKHTYEAYHWFMNKFPNAVQFKEAESRYHLLLFQSMTQGGKQQDYVEFIEKNPSSPYRPRAEVQIFELQTLDHNPKSYLKFLQDYPKSLPARKAEAILYHLDSNLEISTGWQSDSIANIAELDSSPWTVFYQNGRYGFMNQRGEIRIAAKYDSIPEQLLCKPLNNNIFQSYDSGRWKIVARDESICWDQRYDEFQDLGNGYLQISLNNKLGVIHKGGWSVLPVAYDDIKVLEPGFLAFKEGALWGVASMTGRMILTPSLTEIDSEGAFLALRKDRWALLNNHHMIDWYRTTSQSLPFQYDDWEVISPGHLLVISEDKEGVLNENLQIEVPLSKHRIYEVDSLSWCAKTSHGTVRFYGKNLLGIPPDRYENFLATDQFICLERSSKWELWDRNKITPYNEILYDSVSKLGNQLVLLREADLTTVLFPNGATIAIGPRQKLRFIRGADQLSAFLQVSTNGGLREVYDLNGNRIYRTWYFDMRPLTKDLLIIEKNHQKVVIEIKGKTFIK